MKPLLHLLQTALNDREERESIPIGFVDDASRLNRTRVAAVCSVSGLQDKPEEQLRAHLEQARISKLSVSIAGTRHTMGGHTSTPGGLILDMLGLHEMHLDEQSNILHVQAGARWSDVLRYVHERGRSIQVMQSNSSFSVGGSLGANCHGWQPLSPPISSTVVAFRLLLADGMVIRCSREEHAELFSLALGGYGLFGVLLDAELSVTANERYRATRWVVPSAEYPSFYEEQTKRDVSIGLAYGRFNVEPDHFLREILLSTYSVLSPCPRSPLSQPGLAGIRRLVFRGSVGNAYGKALRWKLEKRFGQMPLGRGITRNHLLNEDVEVFQNRSASSTDILQEYFVPPPQLEPFLEQVRAIIPAHRADLLNVTIRFVAPDQESFLRYADQNLFALVMLFHQPRTRQADQQMARLTCELIDAALALGGRYYLPYRLHATLEQFYRAYPQAPQFFKLKRQYDPEDLFQNEWYRKYRVRSGN
jgi:FAD/FMN-containing dehydrogenase